MPLSNFLRLDSWFNSNKIDNKRINLFFSTFLSIILFAQVPLSFIAYEVGISNRTLMIAFRGLILLLSSYFIYIQGLKSLKPWLIITIFFWGFYILRLILDLTILGVSTAIPPWELFAWSLGSSLFPALGTYVVVKDFTKAFNPLIIIFSGVILLGISLLLFCLNFNPIEMRFQLPDLNPIPAGHCGASLFLISFAYLFSAKNKQNKEWINILIFLGCLVGIIITLTSATRSAFLALTIGLILILQIKRYSYKGKSRFWILTGISFSFAACFSLFSGSGLINKIQTTGLGESELNRLIFISSGLKYWLENPIFGKGFEMHSLLENLFSNLTPYYPHNFIVESLLLGGLVLGGLLISLITITTVYSIRLIRFSQADLWLSILWLQACIYVMFSGHLGNVPLFWVTSAAICGRHDSFTAKEREI